MKREFEEIEIIRMGKVASNGNHYGVIKQLTSIFKKVRESINKVNKGIIKTKKVIAVIAMLLVLFIQNQSVLVLAQTAPEPPAPPSAPEEPAPPPPAPDAPSAPSEPGTSTSDTTEHSDDTNDESADNNEWTDNDNNGNEVTNDNTDSSSQSQTESFPTSVNENETGGQDSGGNVGDTTIDTGDAENTGTIVTDGNLNASSSPSGSGGGTQIVNSGNGSDSTNSGSATVGNSSDTTQTNGATVSNGMNLGTVTGDNSASKNVGNSTITTGDANTTGTVINAVNTNIDGVMVNEFNIVDDQIGDVILDFSTGCISGCLGGNTSIENTGNGSGSTNSGDLTATNADDTFQTNDATITNNLILYSGTGDNDADKNTGGDSTITTGDANVSANVLNFANNNLAGDVVYAVVNIFGNLVGDIILPDGSVLSCCANNIGVQNIGNGSDSVNTGEVAQTNTDNIFQFNDADIQNNLLVDANTGDNSISDNTGGANSVTTGDVDVMAQVINVANMNLIGGNWWLVIVNEAGNWIGRIIGAPDGTNMAGSEGMEFVVDENGEIAVLNSGNGTGSTNTGSVDQNNTNNIVQNNNANIVNNLSLSANTGDNSASKNTGGNSTITTGDANVVANIVNFVNNNIVGTGKLFVTVVNVFGSWLGDFVGPGQHKDELAENQPALGGTTQNNSGSNTNNSNSTSSEDDSSQGSQSPSVQGIVAAFKNLSTRGGGSITFTESEGEGENLVADASLSMGTKVDKKKITVNLAWLTLIVPAGVALLILKRRRALKTLPNGGA